MEKFSALVPLRIGSKGIEKKNIKNLAGKPLCEWVIKAAFDANNIGSIYVSTESDEIKQVIDSLGMGIKIIHRPDKLASDTASTESVMLHALNYIDSDYLVTIQATSPLLTSEDLDMACLKFEKNGYDSLLSATRTKHFIWTEDARPLNYNPKTRPRRQDFLGSFVENGAFYISGCEQLARTEVRLHGNIGIYEMLAETQIEIDTPEDWKIIEPILSERMCIK
jgi:CMP-N-acetylneuraminic acid synthetase